MHFTKSCLLLVAGSAVLASAVPAPLQPDIKPIFGRDDEGVDVADGFKRDVDSGNGVDVSDGFKRDVDSGNGVDVSDGFKRDVDSGNGVDVADGF